MNTPVNPKRLAILKAAKQAFLAKGYSGTSMDEIAAAAPVGKATLYSHFPNKQGLFLAVLSGECDDFMDTFSQVLNDHPDPRTGLKAIASAFTELLYSAESLNFYRLIIAEQRHIQDMRELNRALAEPMLKHLSSYLAELDDSGRLRIPDVKTSSELFLAMLHGNLHFRCLIGIQPKVSKTEKQRLIDAAVSLFLKGHAAN